MVRVFRDSYTIYNEGWFLFIRFDDAWENSPSHFSFFLSFYLHMKIWPLSLSFNGTYVISAKVTHDFQQTHKAAILYATTPGFIELYKWVIKFFFFFFMCVIIHEANFIRTEVFNALCIAMAMQRRLTSTPSNTIDINNSVDCLVYVVFRARTLTFENSIVYCYSSYRIFCCCCFDSSLLRKRERERGRLAKSQHPPENSCERASQRARIAQYYNVTIEKTMPHRMERLSRWTKDFQLNQKEKQNAWENRTPFFFPLFLTDQTTRCFIYRRITTQLHTSTKTIYTFAHKKGKRKKKH